MLWIWSCSCHAIHRCEKAYNKYLKNYDKDNKSSYIMYLDANNLYGWAMSQNMDVDGFKWKKKQKNSHTEIQCKIYKKYDEDADKGYILKVDEGYPKRLQNFHNDLSAKVSIKKCHKFVCNLYNKNNYVAHKNFKASIKLWINTRKSA